MLFFESQNTLLCVLGVWIAMTIDWAVRASTFLIRYLRGKWQTKQLI